MKHGLCGLAAATISCLSATAAAQDLTLKTGESGDLFGVYWVMNCRSILKKVVHVDIVSGPPELKAALREEPVLAKRQGCVDKVPGATVVLSLDPIAKEWEGTVRLRVRYATDEGDRQSNHMVKVLLVPSK